MTNFTYTADTTFDALFIVTRYDADGVATGDSVTGTFTGSAVRLARGGGSGDSLVGSAGNDLIAWDDYTTDQPGGKLNGSGDYYLFQNDSQRRQIDSIFGGDGDDVITLTFEKSGERYWEWDLANGGVNVRMAVDGGAGDDVVWGHVPSETLSGGVGDDWIDGGAGNDSMFGGLGHDVLEGDDGDDRIWGDTGDEKADTASKDSTSDAIWGGAGSDVAYGGAGEDFLYGGAGTGDVLYGGADDDWFYVSRDDGAATLVDGGGRNTLVVFGGFATSGDDWFVKGTGVTDGNGGAVGDELGGKAANVAVTYGKDGAFTLEILDGAGGKAQTTVTGDADEVGRIVLWNSDNAAPGQTQELFEWNGSAFIFAGYEG